MRVCYDTNIFISYLMARDNQSVFIQLLRSVFDGKVQLVLPRQGLNELIHTIQTKPQLSQRISSDHLETLVDILIEIAEIVDDTSEFITSELRDPRDNFLLATAVLEQIDYLVSGDRDLLVLDEVANVQIVSPRQFLALLNPDD